jgi:hypothetical protein
MKTSLIAALGAAMIATLGASSTAEAAIVDFAVDAIDGTLTYTGPKLDQSVAFDLGSAILLVAEAGHSGDASGLHPFDTVKISPTDIMYGSGFGTGLDTPLPTDITKSWTDSLGTFTETLTTVTSIDRSAPNAITVTLAGTLLDPGGNTSPVFLILGATQAGGPGAVVSASLTNTSTLSTPEPSTWVMMALGFGALGYAATRKGKGKIAVLSA